MKAWTSFFSRPEKIFLPLGLLFGLAFLLITPPFQIPDEEDHFFTAYAIAGGQSRQAEVLIPQAYADMWQATRALTVDAGASIRRDALKPFLARQVDGGAVPVRVADTQGYSALLYAPQAAGIALSLGLGLPPLAVFWTGRFFALLFFLLATYAALAIAPAFKWVLLLLSLTPMSLFIAGSYSADMVTNSLCMLVFAIYLRAAAPEWDRIDGKRTVLLAVCLLPFLVLKSPYITLLALPALIPPRKYARRWYFAALLLADALVLGAWFLKGKLAPGMSIFEQYDGNIVNARQQLAFILANPLTYLAILRNTFAGFLGTYLRGFVGLLGWLAPALPMGVVALYYPALLFVSLADHRPDLGVGRAARGVLLAAALVVVLGTLTVMYLIFTNVAGYVVVGVQGRYFLPIAPLLCLLFYNRRYTVPARWLQMGVPLWILLMLCISCFSIYARYYG